jgi:DUF1009 family protein
MAETGRPLGIIAGRGSLPKRVADMASAQGRPVFIVGIENQVDPETLAGYPHVHLKMGQANRIIAAFKEHDVVDLVMAGGVRRPSVSELGMDLRAVQFFARIGRRALGDDGLLTAVAKELETVGFRLIGADEIVGEKARAVGLLGRHAPDDQASADIAHGIHVARALGELDIGQSVVVQEGLVLGVEAIEGTDALLIRVGALKREGLGGVLVKVAKPQQDRRIDLPTIGPRTIARAAEAGLRGIAIEAGGTIMLDQDECIAAADAAGLFLVGLDLKADGTP